MFFGLLGLLVWLGEVPVLVVGAYVLLSGVAVVAYRGDKSAAILGTWRTSESTLHLIALLGGWPGAMVARQVLRHKTTKQPFRTIFWCTVLINTIALCWYVALAPV